MDKDVVICIYFAEVSAAICQSIPLLCEASRTFRNVLGTSGNFFTFIVVVTLEICETGNMNLQKARVECVGKSQCSFSVSAGEIGHFIWATRERDGKTCLKVDL